MFKLKNSEQNFTSQDRFQGLQKRLAMVLFSLVLLFIAIQFLVLGVIGVRGNDLSKLRTQQEQQRIENEILRADIMESQVSSKIKSEVESSYLMKETKLMVIDSKTGEVSAQTP
ncbi:hypothetical protein JW796_03925 [Candidatus Dojkabacteria bacterium]|nr:hypothetical protein [Candidatus Dojkabacteria bacterium]